MQPSLVAKKHLWPFLKERVPREILKKNQECIHNEIWYGTLDEQWNTQAFEDNVCKFVAAKCPNFVQGYGKK